MSEVKELLSLGGSSVALFLPTGLWGELQKFEKKISSLVLVCSNQEVGEVISNGHTEIVYAEPWWLMMLAAGFGLKSYLLPDLQAEVACLGSTK